MIVEDEILAQQVLQNHLQKIDKCELIATCNNALEAKQVLETYEIDLMFLDIQLPGMTGLNFLRSIEDPPLVVLTTAYSEYAVESYEFNIIDYLLKPVSFERFSRTIDKIVDGRLFLKDTDKKRSAAADHIFVKSNSKFFKVNFSEIIYVKAMRDYLKIYIADYNLVTLQTMNEMERILPVKQFLRIHKSYIVALAHVKSIYGNRIEVETETFPIGVRYKEKVMQLIKK
ncbi:MAG: LytTR family DNA-binding domain-containing protein [Ginsengibacter sp.]